MTLQDYGWVPKEDNPSEIRDILRKNPLLKKYPYLLKNILLACIEKDFERATLELLKDNKTPKHYPDFVALAISKNNPNLLRTLMDYGFCVNPRNTTTQGQGQNDLDLENLKANSPPKPSALTVAIRHKSKECFELLLCRGVLPNLVTHEDLVESLLYSPTRLKKENARGKKSGLEGEDDYENPSIYTQRILEKYPYPLFKDIQTKKVCPFKTRMKFLNPESSTALLFNRVKTITEMLKTLEEITKKMEANMLTKFLKSKVQENQKKSEPNPLEI